MKKLLMVIVTSVLVVEGPLLAGPLVMSQVSGSANWVVHANQQQFKKTQIGQLIRKEMVTLGIEENLTYFATVFSFHPLDDVRDVTVYGNGKDREKAVVLIDGFFDKEKILSLLRMNPEYKEAKYGNIVLHQWIDENQQDSNDVASQMMYGCFYRDDLIVMGAGMDAVKLAVDVLNGSAKNAAGNIFNQPALDTKGVFIQAVGKQIGELVGQDPDAAAFRQTNQLGLAIGEVEGKFYIDWSLAAKSEEAANAITQMLEGILAFISLPNEEQPILAELAKKIKINCDVKTVKVKFQSEPEVVVQFLKEEWQKNQQKDSKTQ
jgi:hypoxanthine-guanine phosphoribosyltransferase